MNTKLQPVPDTFTDTAGAEFLRRAMAAGYDVYFSSDAFVVDVVSAPFDRPPFQGDLWLAEFFATHRTALTLFLRSVDDRTDVWRGQHAQTGRRS